MLQVARALAARRRGARQDGFALMFVLGVIALTAVVTAALLGLLMTTMRVTSAHERMARELRAADGAIESAIAQMRRNPSGADPCATSGVDMLSEISFDQGTAGTGDDVDVEVTCTASASAETGSTDDQVRLVGADGYQGDIDPASFPWASTPAGLSGSQPNLVHSGNEPLQFLSGVTVKRGAAVLGHETRGAVRTTGEYIQGQPGLGSGGSDCGILAGPATATWVDDLDRAPECNSAEAAAVDGEPTDSLVGFEVDDARPAVPSCSGSVVTFEPGYYDFMRTRQVNALTGGGCTNKTFYFQPGVYYFDADSGSEGDGRYGLEFGDAGSYYVFGQPVGWSTGSGVAASGVAGDPSAPLCEPKGDGSSIVLSARTEIRHTAGRVAICPKLDAAGEPFPAIYQETSVPTEVEVTGSLPWAGTFVCSPRPTLPWLQVGLCPSRSSHTYVVDVAAANSRTPTSIRVLITGSESLNSINNVVSTRRTSIEVRRGDGSTLCSTGEMSGTPNSGFTSSFELLTGGCASALSSEAMLDGQLRITHSMQLGCVGAALALAVCSSQPMVVDDVKVVVNGIPATVGTGGVSAPAGQWQDVGHVAADDAASATPVIVGSRHLVNPGPACTDIDRFCWVAADGRTPDQPFVHSITVGGFAVDLPPDLDGSERTLNLTGLRALVKLEGFGWESNEFFAPDMTISARLTTGAGVRCYARAGWVNSSQEVALDLLGEHSGGAGCSAVLESLDQLTGASLELSFQMPCVSQFFPSSNQSVCQRNPNNDRVIQVAPPKVQHIRLSATTDTYTGPIATSKLTIDATDGATGSAFNAMGKAWMPLSDVDVQWNGAATGRPLFGDDLVLNGLGSQAATDALSSPICCGDPDSRTVELTAWIDGVARLRAKIRFGDVVPEPDPDAGQSSPGHVVNVLEWISCARVTCPTEGAPGDPPVGG